MRYRTLFGAAAATATIMLAPACDKYSSYDDYGGRHPYWSGHNGGQPTSHPESECTATTYAAPVMVTARPAQPDTAARTIAVAGALVYVADADNKQLVELIWTGAELAVSRAIPLPGSPYRLIRLPSGAIWVALRHRGELVEILPFRSNVERTIVPVGPDVGGLAYHPNEPRLYVTIPSTGELVVVDTETRDVVQRVWTDEEPRAVTVSRHSHAGPYVATVVHRSAAAQILSLGSDGELSGDDGIQQLKQRNPWQLGFDTDFGPLPRARQALSATVHPLTGQALVAHVTVNSGVPDNVLGQAGNVTDGVQTQPVYYNPGFLTSTDGIAGRPVEAAISSIGPAMKTPAAAPPGTVQGSLPDWRIGVRNYLHDIDQPVDIRHHPTLSVAFVVSHGTGRVILFNTRDASDDVTRWPIGELIVGDGPVGIAFSADGRWAYVHNAFDLSVTAYDLEPLLEETYDVGSNAGCDGFMDPFLLDGSDALTTVFASDPLPASVSRGRRLFNDATNPDVSSNGALSCGSCHTEGGQDGMVWAGTDGARQTPSLAGRLHDTAPFNWVGSEDTLAGNMKLTVGRMGGQGLDEGQLVDLESFLVAGLTAPPNPNRLPGGLSPIQQHGQEVFMDPTVGCATCHTPPSFTDGRAWHVGTASAFDLAVGANPMFNTPSLRDLWRTAPYLHDGRAQTLMEVLDLTEGMMGTTSHLLHADKEALVAYLLTL